MTSYRIVVLEGDGIGPELIAATLPLLEALAGRQIVPLPDGTLGSGTRAAGEAVLALLDPG